MSSKEYSRRAFLKTFAAVSSAPLLAGMFTACGSGTDTRALYGPGPLYGPSPVGVTVGRMVFLDAQSNQMTLPGSQSVPVHTSFVIQFNSPMNVTSTAAAITLADSNNALVAFSTSWDQYNVDVTITPTADFAHNANYTLSVNDTATDSNGTRLTVNANASASFKTVA